jgi:hypothetical protein
MASSCSLDRIRRRFSRFHRARSYPKRPVRLRNCRARGRRLRTRRGPRPAASRFRCQAAQPGSRADPIADVINPSRQLSTLQRVLNDFGYGPIKVTGTLDEETSKGIERFEQDHNLAVSGQNTPQLRRALGLATGRPLD